MSKPILQFLAVAIFLIGIASCSDDSGTTTSSVSLLPDASVSCNGGDCMD